MFKHFVSAITLAVLLSLHAAAITDSVTDEKDQLNRRQNIANPVVEWNRSLLTIVRTPGAQPATVHSTRNFAILHAAIYDAVNSIAKTHAPFLLRLAGIPRNASQEAAAVAAAHRVLVTLYPQFQTQLDAQLAQDLSQIADGERK